MLRSDPRVAELHEVVSTLALINVFLAGLVRRGDGIIQGQLQKNIELATSAARAEAGKLKVDIRPIDVTRAVAAAVQMVRIQSEAGGVRLTNCVDDRIGQLQTDERKFIQAVVNVLSNAINFTPAGGSVTVRGLDDATNGKVVIDVVDTGIGMTADDIRVALTPFGQADSSLGRRFEGTDLGLPLIEAFVELLGGALTI